MAITTDWQFDLNGITFNRGATLPITGSTISVTALTGFDLPDVNSTVSTRSNSHGSFVTAKYKKERVVTVAGRLNTTAANYATDIYTLKAIFAPQDNPVAFTFRMPGFANQYMLVNPQGVRYPVENLATAVGWVDFIATMTAGDPHIYASALSSLTLGVGVTATATNIGTDNAPVVLTFTGPLTNPKVTNNTTGFAFGVTQAITTGQTVVANTTDATVYNGSVSQFTTITPAAKVFLELAPGANSLTLSATAGSGTATVQWHSTWS